MAVALDGKDVLEQVVADHPATWRAYFPHKLADDLTAYVVAHYFGRDHVDFLFDAHGADRAKAKKAFLAKGDRCAHRAWRDVVLDSAGLRSDPSVHIYDDEEDPRGPAAAQMWYKSSRTPPGTS